MVTSTDMADILGWSTADSRYNQLALLFPYMQVQINDYCGGYFSRQVKEEEVTFTAGTTTDIQQLGHYPVVKKTAYVTSTDRSEYFYGDTQFGTIPSAVYYIPSTEVRDYEIQYSTGGIFKASSDSQIGSTESIYVTYAYVDITDGGIPALARLLEQSISQSGGIASETVGALSRSYFQMGFDPVIKNMLMPYRRVKVV